MERYPHAPGYARDSSTSRAAAAVIEPRMKPLQTAIIGLLRLHGPMTADEIATKLGRHVLGIRPRLTELFHYGLVERTAATRPSALGNEQHVMRLTERGHGTPQDRSNVLHESTVTAPVADSAGQMALNLPQ